MPVIVAAAEDIPSDEDGNSTILPDLIIDTLDYPANPEPGRPQNIAISVKNQGTSTSEKTMLTLYIDGSAVNYWNVPMLFGEESNYESYT